MDMSSMLGVKTISDGGSGTVRVQVGRVGLCIAAPNTIGGS